MKIAVSGHGFDVGPSLSNYIVERISSNVEKYLPQAVGARVSLSKEGRLFHVDVILSDGILGGGVIKSGGESNDPYLAFDASLSKILAKLRRYKDRLKERHSETKYSMKLSFHQHESDEKGLRMLPIKEEKFNLRQLSLEGAIMHMELMSLPALVFINLETKKLNIVYREGGPEGTVVLLDTDQEFKESN